MSFNNHLVKKINKIEEISIQAKFAEMDSEEREEYFQNLNYKLQRLGSFTVNDSKIYTTLLLVGLTSPARIAEKSNVDRARVYDSLKRMVKRGIVEEEPVPRAPRYRAYPPKKVLGEIRKKLNKKVRLTTELEKNLAEIKVLQPIENSSVWSIKGENKILKLFKKFLDNAENHCFIIISTNQTTSSIRELEKMVELLIEKRRINNDIVIKIAINVFPNLKEQKRLINRLFHSNIEIYKWNAGSVMPFEFYLTENNFIQTYLSNLTPKPQYEFGIFMENASKDQLIGFHHLNLWVYTHLCQKIIFKKKNE